jgi:hypothetical protein
LGFIYFNYKRQKEQSMHILLASLLRQFYETSLEAFVDAEGLHTRHKKHSTSPKREEIEEVLRNGIARCHEAYIILDALDEYLESFSDRAIRELLNVIQGLGSNIKLMVTSRVLGAMEGLSKRSKPDAWKSVLKTKTCKDMSKPESSTTLPCRLRKTFQNS